MIKKLLLYQCKFLLIYGVCVTSVCAQDLATSAVANSGETVNYAPKRQEKQIVSLQALLTELGKKYGVNIVYDGDLVLNKQVNLMNVQHEKLEDNLKAILTPLDLDFKKVEKLYLIQPSKKKSKKVEKLNNYQSGSAVSEMTEGAQASSSVPFVNRIEGGLFSKRDITVTGKVTAKDDGMPLPGVNVLVKGSTAGTITGADGDFTLNVPDASSVLVFSFIGYATEEVIVGNQTNIQVALISDVKQLSEVVVVGYGVQKKSLVTGAISSVKSEDIRHTSITRAEQALQGRTAGVQVVSNSGSPGAGMKIRIRGYSSNGNADPLFIVDGVQTQDITYLDPNDIANIEVLKDAASSAIYGARGGNGVVIITTKTGKAGKSNITYDFQQGWQSLGRKPKLMNSQQYATFMNEGGQITGNIPTDVNTDWLDEVFEVSPLSKHHLSFSGGNDKSTFLLSGSYLSQDGIVKGDKDKFERYSFRFNSDHKIANWLKVGHNLAYSNTTRASIQEDTEFGGVISSALMLDPTTPVQYTGALPNHVQNMLGEGRSLLKASNGNYYGVSPYVTGEIVNPFVLRDINRGDTKQDKILGNVFLDITPIAGLTLTSRMGFDLSFQNNHFWNPVYYYTAERNNGMATVGNNTILQRNWLWENFASYNKQFGDHDLTVLAGLSSQEFTYRVTNASGGPMTIGDESYAELDYITTQANNRISGRSELDRQISYFGRVSYNYKERYMLQGSLRRDGAGLSQLPEEGRWGIFPSFSAGWIISNEEFFPDNFISHLKLRGSWGKNGSLSNLGIPASIAAGNSQAYNYASYITSLGLTYQMADGSYYNVAEPRQLPNYDLKWETSVQTNIGIDLGAFNESLTFSVDYYVKKTTDLITPNTPSFSSGNTPSSINGGDVENKGFEFDLGFRNNEGDLRYSVNLNLATLKNEVTYLNPDIARINGTNIGTGWQTATAFEKGQPLWYFRGYKTNGIDADSGNPNFVNTDDDPAINENDKTYIGSYIPNLIYGGNANLEYKGLGLTVFVQGTSGNDVVMGWIRTDRPQMNRPTYFFDGRGVSKPKANADDKTWASDMLLFNGSFLRVKQIQLGYKLPTSFLETIHLGSARVYVSLEDFFTITDYPGMDPEAGSNNNNSLGIDRGVYPIAKKVMVGASISF